MALWRYTLAVFTTPLELLEVYDGASAQRLVSEMRRVHKALLVLLDLLRTPLRSKKRAGEWWV